MDGVDTNGCEWWADCFSCPYPDCVLGGGKQASEHTFEMRARELADTGHSVKDISSILGKSKRTIQRYLAKGA